MLKEIEYTSANRDELIAGAKSSGVLKEMATRLDGTTLMIFEIPDINWQGYYTSAKTDSERIAIIAQKIGLA